MTKTVIKVVLGAITISLISNANPQLIAQAKELTVTLKKGKTTGKLVIGARDANIPFSYPDRQQKQIGYAIDLCTQVAHNVNKRLNLPNVSAQ